MINDLKKLRLTNIKLFILFTALIIFLLALLLVWQNMGNLGVSNKVSNTKEKIVESGRERVGEEVVNEFNERGEASVLVGLKNPSVLISDDPEQYRKEAKAILDETLDQLAFSEDEFLLTFKYNSIPGFAGVAKFKSALDKLEKNSNITSVELDKPVGILE